MKQIENGVSRFVELIVAFVHRRKRKNGILCLAHVLHSKAPNLVVRREGRRRPSPISAAVFILSRRDAYPLHPTHCPS